MSKHTLIFGLSADPLHSGHIAVVTGACQALLARGYELAQVLLVPVYRRNPVGDPKEDLPKTYHHRLAMCRIGAAILQDNLKTAGVPVTASAIEETLVRDTTRPNYTVLTLEALRRNAAADTELCLLISSDLVSGEEPELCRWYRPLHLVRLAALAIAPRPGASPNMDFITALRGCGAEIIYLDEMQTPDISSRQIRARLLSGGKPAALAHTGLLPKVVAAYITAQGLYKKNET